MKMGYVFAVIVAIVCVGSCIAHAESTNYVFETNLDAGPEYSSYGPVALGLPRYYTAKNKIRVRVFVTKTQYDAGWRALNATHKSNQVQLAENQIADPVQITPQLRAIVQAIIQIGNQRWSKGQTVTAQEARAAIKAKLKK